MLIYLWKSITGKRNSRCKIPETKMVCSKNTKAVNAAGEERAKGRVIRMKPERWGPADYCTVFSFSSTSYGEPLKAVSRGVT